MEELFNRNQFREQREKEMNTFKSTTEHYLKTINKRLSKSEDKKEEDKPEQD